MRKKWLAKTFIFMVMALTIVVAGCSKSATNNESGNNAAQTPANTTGTDAKQGTENRTITVMLETFKNEVQRELWTKVAKAFEEQNEGITVKYENGDVAVDSGKLPTMLNSGVTPPDVILMNGGPARVGILSDAELIVPLNDLYEKHKWEDKLIPFAYEMVNLTGTIYEVPHRLDVSAMMYNIDVFEKSGAKVPTTKEQFYEELDKVRDAGYTPITLGTRNGFAVNWLYSQVLDAVAGKDNLYKLFFEDAKWTDEPYLKAAETLKDWVDRGYISKDATALSPDDMRAQFHQKKSSLNSFGSPDIWNIVENNLQDSTGVLLLPPFSEGIKPLPSSGVGMTWVIPVGAENQDLVEKWLNFILEDFAKISYESPYANEVPTTKVALELTPVSPVLAEALEIFKQGSSYSPTLFMGNNAKEAYVQNLQGIVAGLVSPLEAMENVQAAKEKDIQEGFKLK